MDATFINIHEDMNTEYVLSQFSSTETQQ